MFTPYTLEKVRLFKAILPIMIVLHHFAFFYGYPPYFAKLGLPLVSCFFAMSGYGLMTSYLKKGDSYFHGFISHVLSKLLSPYLLALIVYVSIVLVLNKQSLTDYLCKTNFIDWLRFSWFVWVILGGYFLFYFIFKMKTSIQVKVLLYAIVTGVYYLSCYYLLDGKLPCVYRTSYALWLGMIWKMGERKMIPLLTKPYILLMSLVICFITFILSLKAESLLLNPLFSVMLFICLAYCGFKGGDCKIISVLSKVSYEFYLWQGLSILVVCDVLECNRFKLAIPLCLGLNFIFSYLAHYFNKKVICQILVHPRA